MPAGEYLVSYNEIYIIVKQFQVVSIFNLLVRNYFLLYYLKLLDILPSHHIGHRDRP